MLSIKSVNDLIDGEETASGDRVPVVDPSEHEVLGTERVFEDRVIACVDQR